MADDIPNEAEAKEQIEAFIKQMRELNGEEIKKLQLPLGTEAYVAERLAEGDTETIMFMLQLGYVMGLQTGFAAAKAGQTSPPTGSPFGGPIQA